MFVEERHKKILEILNEEGRVKARDIEERFNVAFATARRDLRILEEQGLLKRTHGGAIKVLPVGYKIPNGHTPRDIKDVKSNYIEIAKEAIKYIKENDIVNLTCGSLGYFVAQNLPRDFEYTIVTNSIIIAEELRAYDNITIFVLGGIMNSKGHIKNHFAIEMIKSMRFDLSIITAGAYSSDFGLSIQSSDTILMYQELIKSSRKIIGLFPHEKMGRTSALKICPANVLDILITDWDTTHEEIKKIKELDIEVVVVNQHEAIYQKLKEKGYKGWGGESYDKRMEGWDIKLSKLLDIINIKEGKVLELGSGAGDGSIKLSRLGFEVTGVELSKTANDWARQKAKEESLDIKFVHSSVCSDDLLLNEKYDLIVDGNCLHCLFDEDRTSFYRNTKRLLNKDGHLFISSAILKNKSDEVPRLSQIERCVMTEEKLTSEIEKSGFSKVDSWINNSKKHSHYFGIYKLV